MLVVFSVSVVGQLADISHGRKAQPEIAAVTTITTDNFMILPMYAQLVIICRCSLTQASGNDSEAKFFRYFKNMAIRLGYTHIHVERRCHFTSASVPVTPVTAWLQPRSFVPHFSYLPHIVNDG